MINEYRERLLAALATVRAQPLTATIAIAGIVMFLLLLGGNASVAILISLLVLPFVVLFYLTRLDLYEREPWALLAGVVGAGALIGLIGGFLSSVILERFWFTDSRLNLGAVGFSGISANGEGSVPIGVLLLSGILIPVLTGATVLGGTIVLRRWPVFRNEITDGMTLGALAAGGFATVSAFVYFWPSAFEDLPDRPVSQWTALLAGIVVIRPVVLILTGSLLGIAAWQYASSRDIRSVLVLGIAGVFGWLALPLGSLLLAPSGAVSEFIWYAVVLIIVGVLFRQALGRSLALDRRVLEPADGERRVVCPNCHRVTPDGSFCSFCRAPLHPDTPAALNAALTSEPIAADPGIEHVPDPVPAARFGEDHDRTTVSADFGPADQVAEQSDRDPAPSPVMATDSANASEPPRGGALPGNQGRDLVEDEPEADGFDELDRPKITPSSSSEFSAPIPEQHPFRTPVSGVSPTNDSPWPRDAAERNPFAGDATPDAAESIEPDPAASESEDEGLFPTDEATDRTLPISIQDWSRRSVEVNAEEPADRDRDTDAASAGLPPHEPISSRSGSSDDGGPSLISWPTSGDDRAGDRNTAIGPRPFDFGRSRPSTEGSPMEGDGGNESSSSDQPPVLSSSGRWFDASTSQGADQGRVASGVDDAVQLDDQSPAEPDTERPGTSERPLDHGPDEGGARSNETEPTGVETTPSWPPWYRQGEGINEPDDGSNRFEGDADSAGSVQEGGAEVAAPSESDSEESKGRRTGIFRSFGRQGRSGPPRAPQRDMNGPDSGAAGQSDPSDDKA